MAIVRGLAGLILGIWYALVAGALTFLLFSITIDRPGPMIPDNYGWARIVTVFMTFITAVCGALVGLVVGLSGVSKARAGLIGAALGLVIFVPFFLSSFPGISRLSWPLWKELFSVSFFLLLIFPFGLSLTGMVVSVVVGKLKL